ncbi:HVO_A0114 family putative DNA-binding protein [Erwinia sp. PsM31]|uniref:HVO_A0114 family putative DNA-binding protein n=1 Tax=Erwinia sp. PsM31 TaxID=3030535 RepID=UPI00263B3598|nr:transcriptional regulator [Erwinia sp. PsM31]MDN4626702.1 transcriptional regulator [Erwinia sp. PsM31]
MRTLIVRVNSESEARSMMKNNFISAMSGGLADEPFVHSFGSIEQLAKVMLAPNRLAILHTMAGAQAMSIRELARRLKRDFKAVYRDVQDLLTAEIICLEEGKIIFPFDAVKFDFMIEHRAA